jgi:hypothetical protein
MLFDISKVSNVPQALKDIPRWVSWKAIPNPDGSIRKVPVNPHTGANGSSTDRKTWGTFTEALGFVAASDGERGLGFVFSNDDTIFGLDIDACVTADGLSEAAQRYLDQFAGTYAEYSPSGTGVHLYGYGPTGKGINRASGELYGAGRFFTVTGDTLSNAPHTLAEFSSELMGWLESQLTGVQNRTQGTESSATYQDIDLDESDESPLLGSKLMELSDKYPPFYAVWQRRGKKYDSPSEEEMSIARYAYSAGWHDQEIYKLMRDWRIQHSLPAKHIGAYKLTLFTLHQEPSQVQCTADVVEIDEARRILAEYFPLPIHRLICLGSVNGHYRAIVGQDITLRLGPYEELEKQSVWRKVIFQHAGQALNKITAKKWMSILAAFAAITETEDIPDTAQQAETEQWIEDFTGSILRGGLTYEVFRRDDSFIADGVPHIRLASLLAHVNRTYGNRASRVDMAERLRVLGWRDVSVTCISPDGTEGVKTYWCPSTT